MTSCLRLFRGLGLIGLILGGIVFGAVVGSMATAGFAVAQGTANIVVEGNRRVEADTIRSYFRLSPGQRLDAGKIDEAYKALIATGLFQDVIITTAGGRLVVRVIENAVINRVAFEGNKKVKDDQLTTEVQSKPRGTLSRPTVQADVQRIVEIYRRNGRFNVRVVPKIIDLPNNRVDLVFEITEGEKTGVRKLIFVGNNTFGDQRLKDEIKTNETLPLLSFLQTADIYDPDRIEADRDLIRRFYLKKGFADVRVVSAVAVFDPDSNGFTITFTIEEGARYRFGSVIIQSNVAAIEAQSLYGRLRMSAGAVYNAEAVEKSVENLAIEVARRGYPFATVRPSGDRDREKAVINLVFNVDEGPRIYVERINVRGNIRTRDWVIRREFDVAEGDAYNRALIDRAERRLKNLNYFKSVKITNEPGSAPDRIVINVDVEELSTGELSLAGGYSTADGFMAEVSIGERNLLGNGQYARASVQYGQRARGFEISYLEPFFLGYRLAAGFDIYAKQTLASSYYSYENKTIGFALRSGFALSEEFGMQVRYNIYRQEISLPNELQNCNNINPNSNNGTFPTATSGINPATGLPYPIDPATGAAFTANCYADGEASLAVRRELAEGSALVSLIGYSLGYNTLDNNKNPTSGVIVDFRQDFAGLGGNVNFIRTTVDARTYYEMFADIVTVFRLQAGHIVGWNNSDTSQDVPGFPSGSLRMLDHFQMGPNLVRGFAPAGMGPRDITAGSLNDALGGTMYWGASVEAQIPIHYIPKDIGIKFALFADAGSLWGYQGPTSWSVTGETLNIASDYSNSMVVRSSVGAGLIWNSPFGPLRFDYSIPLTKWCPNASTGACDRIQQFRFGGGTRF